MCRASHRFPPAGQITSFRRLTCWGDNMANDLNVSADGLRVAAVASHNVAAGLTDVAAGTGRTQPSSAGVAALNTAWASASSRQSARMSGQADDLSVSSARYDSTDGGSADAITTVSL